MQKLREDTRFEYVAISRKKNLSKDLFAKATTKECKLSKNKTLTVKKAKVGDEIFLLCQSPDKVARDEAIFIQRKKRFEKALTALKNGLNKPRTQTGYSHICERIGRLKERYRIASFYKIEVKQKDGKAIDIRFSFNKFQDS